MIASKIGSNATGDAEILSRFQPSKTALLDCLRSRVDCSMLREIAESDYDYGVEENFQILQDVRDGENLPVPVGGLLREVLELIRWSEPDDPSWKPSMRGTRGHLMRAFVCGLLLRAAAEPENAGYIEGENQTIIQLVASAMALGHEVAQAALSFLSWCFPSVSDTNEEKPFYAMAILLLQVFLSKYDRDGEDLLITCNWVINEEAKVRSQFLYPYTTSWLLDLTFYTSKRQTWESITRRVLLQPSVPHPPKAVEMLNIIAYSLLD
ncbi:MAG: hypothetical protein VKL59_01735 [Nostocaceae cyanobacterium]|nr:hypothetical protein [Nostocaceae cyanobacterium]